MKYKISDIAILNKSSLTSKETPSLIKYLDTSNITKGHIDNIVYLKPGTDEIPSRAKRKVADGDIIYSTVRPNQLHYGFINKDIEDIIVSTGFTVITPNKEIVNPYYLYCYLTLNDITDYLQGVAENSTTAYPSIKPGDIGRIEIDLPSRENQDYVANLAFNINESIENNLSIIKSLEQIAQNLFKHWFIDFEYPNEVGLPYKSNGGKMIDSDWGEIPLNWKATKIGEEIKIIRGASPRPIQEYMAVEGRPWVKITDANASISCFITKTKEYIIDAGISKSRTVEPGTLILSNSATPGIPKFMDILASVHDGWLIFSDYKSVTKEFMYLYLIQEREPILSMSNGSVFRNLKTDILKNYKLIVPEEKILNKFQNIVNPIFMEIKNLTNKIDKLQVIRDSLLIKLFSGEIEIPNESMVD